MFPSNRVRPRRNAGRFAAGHRGVGQRAARGLRRRIRCPRRRSGGWWAMERRRWWPARLPRRASSGQPTRSIGFSPSTTRDCSTHTRPYPGITEALETLSAQTRARGADQQTARRDARRSSPASISPGFSPTVRLWAGTGRSRESRSPTACCISRPGSARRRRPRCSSAIRSSTGRRRAMPELRSAWRATASVSRVFRPTNSGQRIGLIDSPHDLLVL